MSNDERDSSRQFRKIRDILFGEQVTAQSERFEQLEARMSRDLAALRVELTGQIAAIETQLSRKVEETAQEIAQEITQNITQRFESENERRAEGMKSELRSLQASIEKNIDHQIAAVKNTLTQESDERKASADTERARLSALFTYLSEQLQSAPSPETSKEKSL